MSQAVMRITILAPCAVSFEKECVRWQAPCELIHSVCWQGVMRFNILPANIPLYITAEKLVCAYQREIHSVHTSVGFAPTLLTTQPNGQYQVLHDMRNSVAAAGLLLMLA